MNEIINIIVPVYNVEKYLPQCLDSIINQSYKFLKIILIDDGSTDNSGKICDKYASIDDRILVVHKENGGVSSARNIGLKSIKEGKYISFVDSDDWLDLDMYEKLIFFAETFDADITCCNMCLEYRSKTINNSYNSIQVITSTKEACYLLLNNKGQIHSGVWSKLYKKEIFNDIYMPENMYYEDIYIALEYLLKCRIIVVGVKTNYHYRQLSNSIVTTFKEQTYWDFLKASIHNLKIIEKHYPELVELAKSHIYLSSLYSLDLMLLTNSCNLKLEKFLLKKIKRNLVKILCNKYISYYEKCAFLMLLLNRKVYVKLRRFQRVQTGKERF